VRNFVVEMSLLGFCFVYIANIFWGRRVNAGVAKAWARQFCLPEGIFHKNFAQVGTGECASTPAYLPAHQHLREVYLRDECLALRTDSRSGGDR